MKNKFHVFFLFLLFAFLTSSAWADNYTVSSDGDRVLIPCSGTNKITVGSSVSNFIVYDDGGPDYGYSNNCRGTVVLSAPSNHSFVISGAVTVADGNDTLRIYNSDISSHSWTEPPLMLARNSSSEFSSLYGSSSYMSITFRSNGSGSASGFSVRVNVVETYKVILSNPVTAGSVSAWIPWRKGQAYTASEISYAFDFAAGSRVPLKITENDGFVLSALDLHIIGKSDLLPTYSYNDTLSFTMPSDMLSVNPTFSTISSLSSINMLCRKKTLNIPASVSSFKIYDNGGYSKNYTSSCDATLELNAPEGYKIRLTGSVATEPKSSGNGTIYDYLSIYDGTSNNLTLLDRFYSTSSDSVVGIGTKMSTGRSLTLYFHSDVSIEKGGFDLKAEIVPQYYTVSVASVSNGSMSPVSQSVLASSTVSLTASPNSGYELIDLKVVSASGNSVPFTISGNNVTFTMPGQNVTVTPTFGKYTVTVDASAPSGCLTPNQQYALSGSTVTLTSSCNGSVLTAATIKTASGSTSSATVSGNKVSFTMPKSNVTVIPTYVTDTYRVEKIDVTGGRLSGSDSAKYGSRVPLTVTLDNGYLLNEVKATAKGSSLAVSGGRWYNADSSKKASFVMPLSDVRTTLSVTNKLTAEDGGLFINMPKTGTINATIPAEVKSFKVYDDGGKDGDYSNNSNGTLVLNAPSGYVFELTGTIKTYATSQSHTECSSWGSSDGFSVCNAYSTTTTYTCDTTDNLSVYNGSSTSATAMFTRKYGCTSSGGPSWTSLGKVVSSSNKMTFNFKSGSSGTNGGLALTVTMRKLASGLEDDGNGGKYVNILAQQSVTIPSDVKTFKIYDDGGKDGDYSENGNGTLVLNAPSGYVLELTGKIKTYSTSQTHSECSSWGSSDGFSVCYAYSSTTTYYCDTTDNLSVYNGSSISATALLAGKYGCTSSDGVSWVSIDKITSTSNRMTLNFKSNGVGTNAGLDLTVTMRKLAMELETDGNGVKYVNMLMVKGATLSIPKGVDSIKIYDDGGANGYYSRNDNSALELTVPSGHVIELTGKIKTYSTSQSHTECSNWGASDGFSVCYAYSTTTTYYCDKGDTLNVYDGSRTSTTVLLNGKYGCTSSGGPSWISIDKVKSTGNKMTLNFKSNADGVLDGLNLTAKVVPVDYAVQVKDATNGKMQASKTTGAHIDDVISLEAKPEGAYKLKEVSATDALGNVVKVSQYSFSAAEFTMPASNVMVTPTFTNNLTAAGGLHLDMRKNKSFNADVPGEIKSFKIYDNGGKDGIYAASSNDTLTLTAPEGYRMILTGSVIMERNWEYLYVYDGNNTKATNVLEMTGSANSSDTTSSTDITPITSSGRYMTLRFHSDGSKQYAGLDLTVTLQRVYKIVVNPASGGELFGKDVDTLGAVINLTASGTGYNHLSGVSVLDKNEKIVKSSIYSFDQVKFTLPASDVAVTPTFTSELTAEGGLHLDMLKNGNETVYIPARVKSFRLYDNGGKDSVYESYSSDTLTLVAPTGYRLKVTDSIALETGYDSLYIFDGANTSAKKLFARSSTTSGVSFDVGTITSSGPTLTFYFKSDRSVQKDGLDLKVSVEIEDYVITVNDAPNGRVLCDSATASANSFVPLSWEATTGYLLKDLLILDAANSRVPVNGGWYTGTMADFSMPASNVTITPTFTNDLSADELYIDMAMRRTITATIPKEVRSFKIYDNGGADGDYLEKSVDTLMLVAPEGTNIGLSGNMVLNPEDSLFVFGGMYGRMKTLFVGSGEGRVGSLKAAGNYMMIVFRSNSRNPNRGFELVASVIKPVNFLTVAAIPQQSYTGDSVKPALTITDGSALLVEKRDYRLGYIDNINSGTATVGIVGRGNYFGDTTVTFTISPKVTQFAAIKLLEDERGVGVAVDGTYNGDEAIMITDSIEVDYVDYSRKFSTSGFSTIVLPFDVNTSNVNGLKKVAAFSEIKTNDAGRLVAVMSLVWKDSVGVPDTTLKANTPYMVLMNGTNFAVDGGVTLVPTVEPVVRSGDWEFRGTLAKRVWADGDTALGRVYGFSAEERPEQNIKIGQFVKAGAGAWIRPGRAYLINVPETQGNHVGAGRPAIAALPSVVLPEDMDVVIEEADGSTTFVGRINARTGEFVNMKARTYDLKGRNVNGTKAKGMFIRK